ncbi:MAG: DUF4340 domain-containing protein [Bryobacteraceae bacterium]
MPIRRLLIAAVVLAGLAGGVYWSNREKSAEASKPAKDAPPKMVAIPDDQVKAIEIEKKGSEPAILERDGASKWRITAPHPLPADSDAVSGLTSTLSSISADRVIEDKAPADLSPFGLAAPSLTVTVTKKDNKTVKLLFGDDTPEGGNVYAKVSTDPRVVTVGSFVKTGLDKSPQDLRDKRLLTVDSDKISRVELTAKHQSMEFGRVNQNEWQILKPEPLRADGFQVEELVRKLKDAKMDTSVSDADAKKAAATFAAATPVAIAKLTDASGTQTLEVRRDKDKNYWAKSSVVEGIHKVSAELGDGLDKSVDDFRNKKLFDFGFGEPDKLEIEDGAKVSAYRKSGDKWMSGARQMDATSVNSFMDKARDLSAVKFVSAGFTTPEFQVTVTSNSGKRVEKVLISKNGNSYFAKREGEPSIYELDSKTVEELRKAASDIKEAAPANPAAKKK